MNRVPVLLVAVATLAAACTFASSASAAPRGACASGYSYGGLQTVAATRGIAADVTLLAPSAVTSGHVAAWVGLNSGSSWLQIGISSVPGGTTELYYEAAQPGTPPAYHSLAAVAVGETHRLSVAETDQAGTWVVQLDGNTVSAPIALPGTHGNARPMATSESYDGGFTGCNAYMFRFSDLQVSGGAGWQPIKSARTFANPGVKLESSGPAAVVVSRR
jgi:hypothetical protein